MRDPAAPDLMVVLDIDDTLYLERDYVLSGFNALGPIVRERFGVDGFSAVAWNIFLDGHRGNTFNLALEKLGIDSSPADVTHLVSAYRSHRPEIKMLADAADAISQLGQLGVSIGVLTDGPAPCQLAKIAALGLRNLAEVLIVTDLYGPGFGKPHPRGFQEIAERSRCSAYAYVADNPIKDFGGPHALGWKTIRVRRPGSLYEGHSSEDLVEHTVPDLRNLYTLFEQSRFALVETR